MKMFSNLTAVFLISAGALAAQSTAANVPSTDPAQGSIWDLTVIFPDAAAAERERLAVIADLLSLTAFKGHLGDSAATLRAALDRRSELLERARGSIASLSESLRGCSRPILPGNGRVRR